MRKKRGESPYDDYSRDESLSDMYRRKPRWGDYVTVAIIGLAAAVIVLLLVGGTGDTVVITHIGETLERVDLSVVSGEPYTYTVHGVYTTVVTIENGEAYISQSTCPGQDCVHAGAISKAGESIVCLPNQVSVSIEGGYLDVLSK
ncbi:MAG: NusG domain II-containing protein [Clostridia bacterium]|nr:NusG domain II-containing protein [Clostridia bacterium]